MVGVEKEDLMRMLQIPNNRLAEKCREGRRCEERPNDGSCLAAP